MTDPKDRLEAEKYAGVTDAGKNKFGETMYSAASPFILETCRPKIEAFLAGCAYKQERILGMLRSDEAAHSWWNQRTNKPEDMGPMHAGPSLMSAERWAKWLESRLGKE